MTKINGESKRAREKRGRKFHVAPRRMQPLRKLYANVCFRCLRNDGVENNIQNREI